MTEAISKWGVEDRSVLLYLSDTRPRDPGTGVRKFVVFHAKIPSPPASPPKKFLAGYVPRVSSTAFEVYMKRISHRQKWGENGTFEINQSINRIYNVAQATNSYFKDHRGEEQLKGKTRVGVTK